MSPPSNLFLTLLFILGSFSLDLQAIYDHCTHINKPFKSLYPAEQTYPDYSLRTNFIDSKKVLGSGSFGEVREVPYVDPLVGNIAVKRSILEDDDQAEIAAVEIKVLAAVNNASPQIAPRLYGCQYNTEAVYGKTKPRIKTLYIGQEQFAGDLKSYRKSITGLHKDKTLDFMVQPVRRLRDLWNLGWQHADIKPENLGLSANKKEIFLFDFNLAQPSNGVHTYRGSPRFMPPDAQKKTGKLKPRDDLFSWALTFASLYPDNGVKDLYNGVKTTCVNHQMDAGCLQILSDNISTVMRLAGFGTKQTGDAATDPEKMNVTTLLSSLARFNYDWDFDTVIAIMERNADEIRIDRTAKETQQKVKAQKTLVEDYSGQIDIMAKLNEKKII